MKFFHASLLAFILLWSSIGFAQVTLETSAIRQGSDRAMITVKAVFADGLTIFSILPAAGNDALLSYFEFENSEAFSIVKDSLQEKGILTKAANDIVGAEVGTLQKTATYLIPVKLNTKDALLFEGNFIWLGIQGDAYPNGVVPISVEIKQAGSSEAETKAVEQSDTSATPDKEAPKKGWGLFLLTLLVGFGAVFTPCVFPLIPVTVSFFLKKSKTRGEGVRNAWTYALSIILIYTIPTLIFTLIFGDKFLYQLSTHPFSNLLFFAIFLIFAISFFGAFEISLPSSWANKTDAAAQKGGLLGIFFMALTLVIVSFSCTGPIVGALLGETSGKGISLGPVIGMLGFGIGLAIPFGILALFPSMMKSLPKSGGWLNTVKVFFGFIELALAMKFFSNADLVYHWGILTRPVFLSGWIVIFTLLGLYLLGKLKFSHDSDVPFISVPRIFIAMISFSFALYMLPGMWGAPLKPLSGLLPPPSTQDFDLNSLQYMIGQEGSGSNSTGNNTAPAPVKYIDKFHVPFGLTAYYDLEEAKAASKILKKPIMLDFTGWSCANCRKMENEVWSKPEILERIKNDFVLVSLYVDDRTSLPLAEQYTNDKGERIKTIGDKNLDFEITAFNLNAQPLYKFMDHEGTILSDVQYGYEPEVAKFGAHLDAMKNKYMDKWPQ